MLKINVHLILGLAIGTVTAIAFALAPQLAHAQAPGSLAQLASPDNCITTPIGGNPDCQNTGPGLGGSEDVAVSPDGKNVYVLGTSDDAIAEFTRDADGSLSPIGCIADVSSVLTTCATAVGLGDPMAIAISPNGANVYVTGMDTENNGTIAEFTRRSDGTLTQLTQLFPKSCIAENSVVSDCAEHNADGLQGPGAIAVSPDGQEVYVADVTGSAITKFTRDADDGSLTQPGGRSDCITEQGLVNGDCRPTGTGLTNVDAVVVSPDGHNVYTGASPGSNANSGAIAEFTRNADGTLTQLSSSNDCIEETGGSRDCGTNSGEGIANVVSLAVSPDGRNLYSSSSGADGSIAEFGRGQNGVLTQLGNGNSCIEEQGSALGCADGFGLDGAAEVKVSPDGASVYLATAEGVCCHAAVAEFSRSLDDGSLAQLPKPDNCIDASGHGCFNMNATGIGGGGLAISPDGDDVYVTGDSDLAEFARTPAVHTLTVTVGGSGTGAVLDQTRAITCPTVCSNVYAANRQVTLAATPSSDSTFSGWSGACSGTGSCQVTMSDDMQVTATFTATAPATAGAPTPVLTGAPSAVTDSAAGFQGSVNPDGLTTTVYFQYGLDQRYSQPGASGPNYIQQTQPQSIGPDFSVHGIGPVAVSGLVPNALYHVRIVATNSAGTTFGQDITFTTAIAPAPGAPTLGKTFNIAPVSGLVLVLVHGHLVPLTQLEQIGPGTTIDTRHGTIELIVAGGGGGGGGAHDAAARREKTHSGRFGGAVIRIRQAKHGPHRGLTTVRMVEGAFRGAPSYALCKKRGKKKASDASSKVLELLHASAKGKFTTVGKYSAATVQGAKWTIADRCDGTLVHDIADSVAVTDFVRHKTIILHAGQSYFAPGRRNPNSHKT